MIGAQTDQTVQEHLIEKYMLLPNQVWDSIIQQATKVSFTTFSQSSNGIQEDSVVYKSSENYTVILLCLLVYWDCYSILSCTCR